MFKSMRIRIFSLLLILGCGSVAAKGSGDGDSSRVVNSGPNDSARVTNYTQMNASPPSVKKWYSNFTLANTAGLTSTKSKNRSASTTEESGNNKEYKRWTGLKYSGYIRSYTQYRVMPQNAYGITNGLAKDLLTFNGYDFKNKTAGGYQEPLFLLRIEGSPTAKTWFQMEYMFDNQMMGVITADSSSTSATGIGSAANRRAMVYRIMQFKGYANTKMGDFTVIAGGGVNWYKLSPFTLSQYQYRDDMFERYPWQPEGNSFATYNRFYNERDIARDQRWGNSGTQGFIINGKNLPSGFGFSLVMGKVDNSGGYQTYITQIPKNMFGMRIDKSMGVHKVGLNVFDQFGSYNNLGFIAVVDSANGKQLMTPEGHGKYTGARMRQQIITVDGKFNLNHIKIYTEIGAGRFQDGLFSNKDYELLFGKKQTKDSVTGLNLNWKNPLKAHCFNYQMDISKKAFGVPLSIQIFSVRKSVASANNESLNATNSHIVATPTNINTINNITVFPGAITDIGQTVNNRWGSYIKHVDTYGKLKVTAALGFSKEWEQNDTTTQGRRADGISYWHQANAFTRSRFQYYNQYAGPYGRVTNIYRRSYETYGVADPALANKLKMYQTLNLGLSYKLKMFDRDLILSSFTTYNSVTDQNFSPIPVFTDKALLRTFYTELMAFYSLDPKVTLLGFACIERVVGNHHMETANAQGGLNQDANHNPTYVANGLTINQTGYGLGLGLDYDFSSRAGIYLRNRLFYQNDNHFTLDHFQGDESTVELKIFF